MDTLPERRARYREAWQQETDVAYGFCRCGCGEETSLAPQTQVSKGWVKGEPLKYARGHRGRLSKIADARIIEAYEASGNIWKAGEALGCSGQLVQQRLKALGIERSMRPITDSERERVRRFYEENVDTPRSDFRAKMRSVALELGRTEASISLIGSRMGVANPRRAHTEEVAKRVGVWIKKHQEKHGHPRGALGMKHTAETRARIGEAQRRYAMTLTQEQLDERWRKSLATRKANGTPWPNSPGGGGYGHMKRGFREDIGIFVRSGWEANWARYLNFLVANKGDPLQRWEYEPDTFWFEPIKRGTVTYTPDFKLFEAGKEPYYHEVKGRMDAKSKTKLERMAKYHPSVRVEVIDQKAYMEVKRKLGAVIPGWEF